MNKCISLARTVFVGMAVALLAAALTPATASAGQDKMKESPNEMKDTGMAAPSDMSSPGMAEEGKGKSKEKVIKADNMDRKKLKAQIDAASDDTVIEYKGKKTTKGELKLKAEKQAKEDRKAMEARPASASGSPDSTISQFDQAEKAKLDAANAKVRAEMTRLISANPAGEGAAGQAIPANPAAGSQRQRSLPVQQNVR